MCIRDRMYIKGEYAPLTLEEAIQWCSKLVPLYKKAGITILRIGLQAAEGLESSLVAGPYHPAFGELVESRLILETLKQKIEQIKPEQGECLLVRTRPNLVSKAIGQKRENIRHLEKTYHLSMKIVGDLMQGDIEIQRL
ncbi:MAG: radical SAM protein, partial [Clostridia bacterium]|nr:radical SAM protein [Clostridia bacterium]